MDKYYFGVNKQSYSRCVEVSKDILIAWGLLRVQLHKTLHQMYLKTFRCKINSLIGPSVRFRAVVSGATFHAAGPNWLGNSVTGVSFRFGACVI